jgi:hypothetical protein
VLRANCLRVFSFVLCVAGLTTAASADPVVWSGLTKTFTKLGFADSELPENQDWITPNVAIARADLAGIFNIAQEPFYESASPAGTLWATDLNNPGKFISAANWAELTFDPWVTAYGGSFLAGVNVVPSTGPPRNAVVYLVDDEIVLDLQFTQWGQRGGGGLFSYVRAEGVPEPAAASLAAIALLCFGLGVRRRTIA